MTDDKRIKQALLRVIIHHCNELSELSEGEATEQYHFTRLANKRNIEDIAIELGKLKTAVDKAVKPSLYPGLFKPFR